MIINFNTYSDMLAWPNPQPNDVGIVHTLQKAYTYVNTSQRWLCHVQDKSVMTIKRADDGAVSFAPTIGFNEYTWIENITSAMTSLIITCAAMPDNFYEYEFRFRFTTPETLGITTFQVKDSNRQNVVWIGTAPALVGGKTYEVSVVKDLAIIGVSV